MKKLLSAIFLSVCIMLLVSCSNKETGDTTNQMKDTDNLEVASNIPLISNKVTNKTKLPIKTELPIKTDREEIESNLSSITVPQLYIDYLKKLDPNSSEEVCFYKVADMNLDGKNEIIIGTGTSGKDPYKYCVSKLYILTNNNGVIEQLSEDLSSEGHMIYQVKLIYLQEDPKAYLYCGLTNGAGLLGFRIIGVKKDKVYELCYSASPTGEGEDILIDVNKDGQYDGYTQYRAGYDVLYYPLQRTFKYKNHAFLLENTTVDIPVYPKKIRDVILQFLSLKDIAPRESKEVEKRISQLCSEEKAINLDFSKAGMHTALVNTIVYHEEGIDFHIKEKTNTATVDIKYKDEKNSVHKYQFKLKKTTNKWRIIKVQNLTPKK